MPGTKCQNTNTQLFYSHRYSGPGTITIRNLNQSVRVTDTKIGQYPTARTKCLNSAPVCLSRTQLCTDSQTAVQKKTNLDVKESKKVTKSRREREGGGGSSCFII